MTSPTGSAAEAKLRDYLKRATTDLKQAKQRLAQHITETLDRRV